MNQTSDNNQATPVQDISKFTTVNELSGDQDTLCTPSLINFIDQEIDQSKMQERGAHQRDSLNESESKNKNGHLVSK